MTLTTRHPLYPIIRKLADERDGFRDLLQYYQRQVKDIEARIINLNGQIDSLKEAMEQGEKS